MTCEADLDRGGPEKPSMLNYTSILRFFSKRTTRQSNVPNLLSSPSSFPSVHTYIVYCVYLQPRNSCRLLPQSKNMSSSGGNIYPSNPPFEQLHWLVAGAGCLSSQTKRRRRGTTNLYYNECQIHTLSMLQDMKTSKNITPFLYLGDSIHSGRNAAIPARLIEPTRVEGTSCS